MSGLACAQCGRPLPPDATERAGWRNAELLAVDDLDDTVAGMLLCPECAQDDLHGDYEEGEAG